MAVNKYNPNTGKPLAPGQTVQVGNTGTYVTQGGTGTTTGSPTTSSPSSSYSTPVTFNTNTNTYKPSTTSTGSSYTIQSGDTLSAIAAKNNTTVAAIQAANNISDPNVIYAGANLTIPGQSSPTTNAPTATTVNPNQAEIDRITAEINKLQGTVTQAQAAGVQPGEDIPDEILGGMTGSEYVKTSEEERAKKELADKKKDEDDQKTIKDLQTQNEIASLKQMLKDATVSKPDAFSSSDTFESLSEQNGLTGVKTQIDELSELIRESEAATRQGLNKQEGRIAPMGVISSRQQELQRQANEELDSLNRQKQTLVDEYSTKMSNIGMIMDFKQSDYQTAYKEYTDN